MPTIDLKATGINIKGKIKEKNITVITHVIIGLPGETKEQMIESVDYIGKSGIDGIKLQLLHVIKNTDLEQDYLAEKFRVLTMEEYIDIIVECIAVLPRNVVVHRMTGDGERKTLVAPLWSTDKKRVLNTLRKRIEEYRI